jgi:hypothetical protein
VLERIPEYNALDDKYCSGFRAMKGRQKAYKKQVIMAPGGIRAKRPLTVHSKNAENRLKSSDLDQSFGILFQFEHFSNS